MTKDETLQMCLEYIETDAHERKYVGHAIKQALVAPTVQEPVEFFDWYDNAHWGNEDFKEGCHRSWNAAIKYTTPPAAQRQCEGCDKIAKP